MKKKFLSSHLAYKELASYFFDISKLTVGSLILKFFEPQSARLTFGSFVTMLAGLILAGFFATLGLWFAKEVKQ